MILVQEVKKNLSVNDKFFLRVNHKLILCLTDFFPYMAMAMIFFFEE